MYLAESDEMRSNLRPWVTSPFLKKGWISHAARGATSLFQSFHKVRPNEALDSTGALSVSNIGVPSLSSTALSRNWIFGSCINPVLFS